MIRRRLLAASAVSARLAPRLTYLALSGAAPAAHGRPWAVRADEVAHAFPDLKPSEVRAVTRRSRAMFLRNLTLMATVNRFGSGSIADLVRPHHAVIAIQPPAIVGTFHIGPLFALGPVLDQFQGEIHVLRWYAHRSRPRPNVVAVEVGGGQQQAALAFRRALEPLNAGGSVLLTLDPLRAAHVEVPMLGRRLKLGRGAFALAERTGAPVVPLITRWSGTNVVVECGEPVAPHPDPQQMAGAVAAWLERHLREHPEQLSRRTLDLLS